MGIKRHLPAIPFIITASGLFFKDLDIIVPLILLVIVSTAAYFLRDRRLPFWIFLIFSQVLIHLSQHRLSLFYFPIIFLNPIPIYNFYLLGSEVALYLLKGMVPINAIPLGIFVVAAYIYRKEIQARLDSVSQELSLIRKRSELILPSETDAEKLLASFKASSPHPAIYRPILYFLSYLRKNLDAQTVAFFYKHGDELVLILGVSTVKDFKEGIRIKSDTGIVGYTIKEGRELIVPDYDLPVSRLGYYQGKSVEVKSVATIPVTFGERIEGVLVIDSNRRSYADENREEFKSAGFTLAYLTGMIRLYEQQKRDAVHYSALYEMARRLQKEVDLDQILEISAGVATTIFDCDHVGISAVDVRVNQGEVLYSEGLKPMKVGMVFPLEDGLVGWIAKYRKYLINNQLKKGKLFRVCKREERHPYNSFIGVPIIAEGDVFGVLWIESRAERFFREEDSDLLNFLAFQLSLAWNRAILHQKMADLAIRDSLTGLFNHRHFHEELDRLLSENKRLVLLMVDIDHFKEINDRNGHQVGDQVLLGLAKVLKDTGWTVARYGGEEFVLIQPGLSEKKGLEFAIKLREKIKALEIRIGGKVIRITVSIGLAFYPKDGFQKEELIKKADTALYRAKKEGRDRVAV